MENDLQEVVGEQQQSPVDFTGLEEAIEDLNKVIQEQFQQQQQYQQEKEEQEELHKKEMENKQNENAETLLQDKEIQTNFQESLLSNTLNSSEIMEDILLEIQTQNELQQVQYLEMREYYSEGFISIILTIIIVAGIKTFTDQITRW